MELTPEIMEAVARRVCTYRCGECAYLETGTWQQHQAHYVWHGKEKRRQAGIRAAMKVARVEAVAIVKKFDLGCRDAVVFFKDMYSVAMR